MFAVLPETTSVLALSRSSKKFGRKKTSGENVVPSLFRLGKCPHCRCRANVTSSLDPSLLRFLLKILYIRLPLHNAWHIFRSCNEPNYDWNGQMQKQISSRYYKRLKKDTLKSRNSLLITLSGIYGTHSRGAFVLKIWLLHLTCDPTTFMT